jgi:hypothetical protein
LDETFFQIQERLAWIASRQVVFVVGTTRWGTIWLERALDAHPEVSCRGEGHFVDSLFPLFAKVFDQYNRGVEDLSRRLGEAGYPPSQAGLTRDDVVFLTRAAALLTLSRWTDGKSVKCVAERTPEHVTALAALDRALPGAKFVHVIRDGRDEAIAAWEFNQLSGGKAFAERHPRFESFAEEFARHWTASVGNARRFGRAHSDRYFEVKCERFLDSPTPVLAHVCQFLGVDRREAAVRPCADAAFAAAPIDINAGHWRDHVDKGTLAVLHRHAGELLKLLGYDV